MNVKYDIGQKVVLKLDDKQSSSPRDCTIEPYVGQVGQVTNYYWINPPTGEVFYLYMVRVGEHKKEIALYEDEIEAYLD